MSLRYNVRSRYLVDIVNDMKSKKLILAPYFQRKLVWREAHKVDFIKTILDGFPFPEVFFSRGRINLDDMTSTISVVDGQQRLSTILQFIENDLEVDGKTFKSLSAAEKEDFLKYEIAIIDLDLPDNDSTIIEIFKRLNRTFYALSSIEKQATEFASSEFMLVAKFLAGEIGKFNEGYELEIEAERIANDPNIQPEFLDWCENHPANHFHTWLLDQNTFSAYEISRQVHLNYTLLIMSTIINGISQRNDKVKLDLEKYVALFPEKDAVVQRLDRAASVIERAKPGLFWRRKSNAFSLIVATDLALTSGSKITASELKTDLQNFAKNPPADYSLAAKEGVNNRKERKLRHRLICQSIFGFEVADDEVAEE